MTKTTTAKTTMTTITIMMTKLQQEKKNIQNNDDNNNNKILKDDNININYENNTDNNNTLCMYSLYLHCITVLNGRSKSTVTVVFLPIVIKTCLAMLTSDAFFRLLLKGSKTFFLEMLCVILLSEKGTQATIKTINGCIKVSGNENWQIENMCD